MTKDLRQQGLSDVEVTNNGAVFNLAGKLGGCYLFDGSNDYLVGTYEAGAEVSFAAWVNLPTLPGGRHIFDARTSNGTGYQPMYLNSSSIQIGCSGSSYSSFTYTWVANTWYHICVTHNATEGKCYVNGILIGTSTAAKGINCGTCNFTLGSRCNQSNYSNVKLNDVRIYDHCLSPMEVKELSKGLIVHYPLNRNGFGQENLVHNSNQFRVGGHASGVTPSVEEDGTYKVVAASGNSNYSSSWWKEITGIEDEFVEGENFTISFWIKSNDANKTNPPTIYLKSGMGYYSMKGTVSANYSQVYYTGTWKKANSLAPHLGWSGLVGTYYICQWKIEKGSIPTPWCPNSSDALATTMGLNGTTEYDCSGFCNNGTRTGTFEWTSNTAKYAVSTKFNGTDNAIQTPSLPTMITDKNYTIAVWIYKTVIGSKGYQTIYGGPTGFEIEARNGGANEAKFVPWNWGKPMASYELNEWNHCVFVHSDADCKIYLNGEYIATGTAKASNPTGNYFVGAWNTATQQNFEGLMSDFRIYATALSADDVKNLYQNSAYISSNGTAYAHEFVEE